MEYVTLQQALMNEFQSYNTSLELYAMLYRQMYNRWNDCCNDHGKEVKLIYENALVTKKAHYASSLPEYLVKEFMTKNIVWAKECVEKRINAIMWPNNAPLDMEYNSDAIV